MLIRRGVAQVGRDRGAGIVEDVTEHHPRAFRHELTRLGLALAARGARDERDLAVEPVGHRRTVALARLNCN